MQKIKDFIYYNRKEIITVLICISAFISFSLFSSKSDVITMNTNLGKEKVIEEIKEETIMVDIKGEIQNPGTYELEIGNRIIDVINKSGGLTDDADIRSINLSEKLEDEMLIIIPSKEESVNNQPVINSKNNTNVNQAQDSKISINTANVSTLMTLKGIGQKKAESIVEYREKNGLFKKIEDITNVSGIGNSIFDKIKDYIKV